MNEHHQQHHPTTSLHEIPEELQCFDVQEVDGILLGRVGIRELRAAVAWLEDLAEVGHV